MTQKEPPEKIQIIMELPNKKDILALQMKKNLPHF